MRRLLPLLLAALPLCAPAPARAHGGPPLRIGVVPDAPLAAIGRLALVHLREAVGFAVIWQEYADEAALHAGFAAGKLDIVIAAPAAGDLPPAAPATACTPERLEQVRAALGARWGAEAFPVAFAPGPEPCLRPAIIVARGVLTDLRFGILGKETRRLAALVTPADVAAVVEAAARGGERAAVAAARAALARKPAR